MVVNVCVPRKEGSRAVPVAGPSTLDPDPADPANRAGRRRRFEFFLRSHRHGSQLGCPAARQTANWPGTECQARVLSPHFDAVAELKEISEAQATGFR